MATPDKTPEQEWVELDTTAQISTEVKERLVAFLQEIVDDNTQTIRRRATAELLKRQILGTA